MTDITALLAEATVKIKAADDLQAVDQLRVHYLGKKGVLTEQLKSLGEIPEAQRPQWGKLVNEAKKSLQQAINEKKSAFILIQQEQAQHGQKLDVTLPGLGQNLGYCHPLTRTRQRIEQIFLEAGFELADGPEIEDDYHNFAALNVPANHPARDMQDTFYITDTLLLRTQTSPIQIRVMEQQAPPLRLIASGRVYRSDTPDLTHSPMFHQIEGLVVDEHINFSHLKGVINHFLQCFFEKKMTTRFRPSFFPFTEPSAEVDISCVHCNGKGCRVCGQTGWLEVLGCGMVHPNVFRQVNVDIEKFSGFAFGLGVERLCMLLYGVTDIRFFYDNDLRFLRQF